MRIVGKKSDRVLLFDFADKPVEPVKPKYDRTEATRKASKTRMEKLSPQEKKFCREYVKTGKAAQSVIDAGYNVSNLGSAGVYASHLLSKDKIKAEINRLQAPEEHEAIATAREVMEFLTRMMNGQEKDQFGLETSAADRLKAAVELAKRTVDLDNKVKMAQQGVPDNTMTIKLDWGQS